MDETNPNPAVVITPPEGGAPPPAPEKDPAADAPPAADPGTVQITPPPDPDAPPAEGAEVIEYDPTGDTGLDLALGFVGGLGFGPTHPAIVAAQTGDFTKLEAAMGKMGDRAKGFDRYLKVAKESSERVLAKRDAAHKATADVVYGAVGGEEAWKGISAWVLEVSDPDELKQVNAALAAGGVQAKAMANQLAQLYKAAGKATAKSAVKQGASNVTASAGGPLNPEEYKAALRELTAKHGSRVDSTPEFAEITQRRRAYKG